MSEESALKHLFGKALLVRMANALAQVDSTFQKKKFLNLLPELERLEMKPRVHRIRDELKAQLPSDFPKALRILLQATGSGKLQGFDLWPFTEFIQLYGIQDLKISLEALRKITTLFTSEFAVRPFLKNHRSETLKFLEKCADDQNVHVRRWASEGTRPRLPWGERLHDFIKTPSLAFPILEKLKFDPELYVRKSVSNHLNDIAKDHPEVVISLLKRWKKEAGEKHSEKIEWIIHRALRTLIKAGHPEALSLIGVIYGAQVKISAFKMNAETFKIGERIEFEFKIKSLSNRSQKLVIDYIVHFVRANQSKSPKVFKLKTVQLPAQGELLVLKNHSLKEVTTRKHYPGVHLLEVQVNGKVLKRLSWTLKKEL